MIVAKIGAPAIGADLPVGGRRSIERVTAVDAPAVQKADADGVLGAAERTGHADDAIPAEDGTAALHADISLRTAAHAQAAADAIVRHPEAPPDETCGGVFDPTDKGGRPRGEPDVRRR